MQQPRNATRRRSSLTDRDILIPAIGQSFV
jgi:hypothetical protein